jgi:uncharacterized protein (TIGR02271 family)
MSDFTNTSGSDYGQASNRTLTAFFDERDDAEEAVERLRDLGIGQASVRMTEGRRGGEAGDSGQHHKGFWESLADFFMPDADRYSYAEGLSRGGYLVTVSSVPAHLYDEALDILDDEGSVNMDEREQSWRSEGWAGYSGSDSVAGFGASSPGSTATGSAAYGSSGTTGELSAGARDSDWSSRDVSDEESIPVVREDLRIGKRDVSHGRVRVRSYVVEEPVNEQVTLHDERVVVERRPVDRELSAGDTAFRDRTIEAEEYAEEAVVDKRARVTEEISLRKEAEDRTETISDTVRHTEVEVEDEREGLDRTLNRGSGSFDR